MKRFFLVIFPFLLCANASLGQESSPLVGFQNSCKITLVDSPSPLGLNLGMTPKQAAETLGRSVSASYIPTKILATATMKNKSVRRIEQVTTDSIGESEFTYYPRADSNTGSLNLRFWRDQLYSFGLNYDTRDFNWSSTNPDSLVIAETLRFPTEAWEGSQLVCSEFYIKVERTDDGVRVEITNSVIKDEIKIKAEKNIAERANKLPLQPDFNSLPRTPPVLKNRKPN